MSGNVPMAGARRKLGEILIDAGVLDDAQLRSALGHQRQWGGRLGHILIDLKLIDEHTLAQTLASQLGLELCDLGGDLDIEVVRMLPQSVAERHAVFPLRFDPEAGGGTLTVVFSDPTNLTAIDEVRFQTGKTIQLAVASEGQIALAIRRYYYGEDATEQPLAEPSTLFGGVNGFLSAEDDELVELEPIPSDSQVPQTGAPNAKSLGLPTVPLQTAAPLSDPLAGFFETARDPLEPPAEIPAPVADPMPPPRVQIATPLPPTPLPLTPVPAAPPSSTPTPTPPSRRPAPAMLAPPPQLQRSPSGSPLPASVRGASGAPFVPLAPASPARGASGAPFVPAAPAPVSRGASGAPFVPVAPAPAEPRPTFTPRASQPVKTPLALEVPSFAPEADDFLSQAVDFSKETVEGIVLPPGFLRREPEAVVEKPVVPRPPPAVPQRPVARSMAPTREMPIMGDLATFSSETQEPTRPGVNLADLLGGGDPIPDSTQPAFRLSDLEGLQTGASQSMPPQAAASVDDSFDITFGEMSKGAAPIPVAPQASEPPLSLVEAAPAPSAPKDLSELSDDDLGAALRGLDDSQESAILASPVAPSDASYARALARLLIKKGLIDEAELLAALSEE